MDLDKKPDNKEVDERLRDMKIDVNRDFEAVMKDPLEIWYPLTPQEYKTKLCKE